MIKFRPSFFVNTVITALLLIFAAGLSFAAGGDIAKPEMKGKPKSEYLAEKKEVIRRQQGQRISHDKRKAAAEALKAERLKVYNAKKSVKN